MKSAPARLASSGPPARACCGYCRDWKRQNNRLDVRLLAYPFNRLFGRNGSRSEDGHGDRAKLAIAQSALVGIKTARHAEAHFIDVRTDDGVVDALLFEHVKQHRQIHRDEARLGIVALAYVVGENREGLLETQAQQQIDHHVLQKDNGRIQPGEHLHFRVHQQGDDAFDILGRQCLASTQGSIQEAFVGRETLECAHDAVFRDGIGILVGIRHARHKFEILVAYRVGAHVIAYLRDTVMRRAHEGFHSFIVCIIEYADNGLDILKAHGLGPCFFLRHMIYTEELIITK
ncbi:hypothetical protein BA896_002345 [Janthinobacterium lividum]|uniref:Uncharacterized protein n=1 Tax=Janthinobacterium lividum TaxID=29581 RepID=A0A1E8PQU9_9BURK|nr:hypothetical protein BA896_002345 [Janthinobacterium lividum]